MDKPFLKRLPLLVTYSAGNWFYSKINIVTSGEPFKRRPCERASTAPEWSLAGVENWASVRRADTMALMRPDSFLEEVRRRGTVRR